MSDARAPALLLDAARPQSYQARWLMTAGAATVGVCLLTLSAKIQVPFWPVPMTLQTLAVLMLAMSCGARLGVATVVAYLAAGAAGLPVFAGTPERGIGFAYMMGPTGGFLVGFVLAAWLAGTLAERGWDRSFLKCALAMLLGHVVTFAAGLAWLTALMGATKAIDIGLLPFLAASAVKIGLGAALMPLLWRVIGGDDASATRR
jgi:biotin transport system substrate-specific component